MDQQAVNNPAVIGTVYDMVKAVDRGMVMEGICVVEKRGGKSGEWTTASSELSG